MRRNQLTITYPEGDAHRLHQALLLLKGKLNLNISAFCRKAIAESLSDWRQSNESYHHSAA